MKSLSELASSYYHWPVVTRGFLLTLLLKHLTIGALASYVHSVRYMSEVRVYRRLTRVQLMRGEFFETTLYWTGMASVLLGAIAEKKVRQHFCVRVSVCVRQPGH